MKRVPWENLELLKRLADKFQNRIVFAICSYMSASQSNFDIIGGGVQFD